MKYLLVLLVLMLCGCDRPEYVEPKKYSIIVIDSCEYIYINTRSDSMIHKANCKNHKRVSDDVQDIE